MTVAIRMSYLVFVLLSVLQMPFSLLWSLVRTFAVDSGDQCDHDDSLCHPFGPFLPALLRGRPMEPPPPQERLPQGSEMGSRENLRVSDLGIT